MMNKNKFKWKAQIFDIWYKSCWFVLMSLDSEHEKCQNGINNSSMHSSFVSSKIQINVTAIDNRFKFHWSTGEENVMVGSYYKQLQTN